MTFQKQLFYLGSEKIMEGGGSLRFKLTHYIFDDEDASVLSWDTDNDLFYAHDSEFGFLVVRSEFAENNQFWYDNDTLSDRFVSLDKPTQNIRRITIPKPVRENPSGPLESACWELSAGKTVHYITTVGMISEEPKSFYILDTQGVEKLAREKQWTWRREKDRERLQANGYTNLAAVGHSVDNEDATEGGSRPIEPGVDPEVEIIEVEIESIPQNIYEQIDLNYLLVRYGVNELLEQDPPKEDKRIMEIRNDVFNVQSDYRSDDQTIVAEIPMRIHDRFPTEFKLFVDVEDSDRIDEVKETFASSPTCEEADVSYSLESRVFILLNRFATTISPEGFVNNVIYPK